MSAASLMTYFAPLKQWLEEANTIAKDCIGWDSYCESFASDYVYKTYETETSSLLNAATVADWNYNTNLTDENAIIAVRPPPISQFNIFFNVNFS